MQPNPGEHNRILRVFLSSTFLDFMAERDLLVKQVFPRLRQKAKRRGVEVIDVDLRWGITEQESEQGKVIPICLAEINNCKPYFIGMIGERYGWIPAADQYSEELQDREPWLKQHLGGVSVTELEVLYGVLNNPSMAARVFFYFRDANWSKQQQSPDFLCEGPKEEKKLQGLKQRIRSSGFPVTEDLPDPQAMADAIEADLWELIEQQFPEQQELSLLEQEARKHDGYRQARTGLYLGGEAYLQQLEQWLDAGEQRLLISGESGSGKSALIANWAARHAVEHPGDTIYCHHLSANADANQLRPLLARLINTASEALLAAELISEVLTVPEDWWELTAKVAETLQTISALCRREGKRWIIVLDGLDRLSADDQQLLPSLPLVLPDGLRVIAAALECPAKQFLLGRNFKVLTIKALDTDNKNELIESYLRLYSKKFKAERRHQIINHPLTGSPLFLRVLLEELRQCGRYETLDQQLEFYLSSQTIDALFERVLERLEVDAGVEVVKSVMTKLWTSRSGLSEVQLLAIAGIAPLQWAPIELALGESFSRNGERLIFSHDYLRIAVSKRYLAEPEQQRSAHSALADWFKAKESWDKQKAEELPWQLQQANLLPELRDLLLLPTNLAHLSECLSSREVVDYWLFAKGQNNGELDELIADAVEEEIVKRRGDAEDQIWLIDRIAALLAEAGLYRELLLKLRTLSLEFEEGKEDPGERSILTSLSLLASTHREMGNYEQADVFFTRCLEARERLLGPEHPDTLISVFNLATVFSKQSRFEESIPLRRRELAWCCQQNGEDDSGTLSSINALAIDLRDSGEMQEAETLFRALIATKERLLGPEDFEIGRALGGLAKTLEKAGKLKEAEEVARQCYQHRLQHEGSDDFYTNRNRIDLARVLHKLSRNNEAIALLQELQTSMAHIDDPNEIELELIEDSAELLATIKENL